ncbi:MAG: hypothetical protein J1E41_05410 [Ruminococcus sp.]|nr:hypothetical protein [Ruminococcus sp.]
MKHIVKEGLFSPSNYLEMCTGKYYILGSEEKAYEFINLILKARNVKNSRGTSIRSYAFDNIEKAISDNAKVVLVDVSDFDEEGKPVTEYCWYEVPNKIYDDDTEE